MVDTAVPALGGVIAGNEIDKSIQPDPADVVKKGMQDPEISKAVEQGKQKHKDFAEKVKSKEGWQSEPKLIDPKTGKSVKPDAVSPSGRPVELKPNTPSGRAKGKKQLEKYERATGKKGKVIHYEKDDKE